MLSEKLKSGTIILKGSLIETKPRERENGSSNKAQLLNSVGLAFKTRPCQFTHWRG
jgi:hypothetical protein